MYKRVFGCLLVVAACLAVLTPCGALAETSCTFYYDSQPIHNGPYEYCGGSNPMGCSECTWTGWYSVQSCVMEGEADCFAEEHQN